MQLLEKNNLFCPTRWNVVSIGRGGGSTVDRMVGFPLGWIFILSGWRRIDTDVWTTQDNSSYHNNVKMRVDAWKHQGTKVFANCKAIVANSIFFSKLATMANGSWSPTWYAILQPWIVTQAWRSPLVQSSQYWHNSPPPHPPTSCNVGVCTVALMLDPPPSWKILDETLFLYLIIRTVPLK